MHEYYSYRVNQLSLVTEVYLDRYTLYRVQAATPWKYQKIFVTIIEDVGKQNSSTVKYIMKQ